VAVPLPLLSSASPLTFDLIRSVETRVRAANRATLFVDLAQHNRSSSSLLCASFSQHTTPQHLSISLLQRCSGVLMEILLRLHRRLSTTPSLSTFRPFHSFDHHLPRPNHCNSRAMGTHTRHRLLKEHRTRLALMAGS
jgi:hypothetical protein